MTVVVEKLVTIQTVLSSSYSLENLVYFFERFFCFVIVQRKKSFGACAATNVGQNDSL
jgi:hypothetical protein